MNGNGSMNMVQQGQLVGYGGGIGGMGGMGGIEVLALRRGYFGGFVSSEIFKFST